MTSDDAPDCLWMLREADGNYRHTTDGHYDFALDRARSLQRLYGGEIRPSTCEPGGAL